MDVPQLEAELAALAEQLTAPLPGECLHCYLTRVVHDLGCTGLRFTERWACPAALAALRAGEQER